MAELLIGYDKEMRYLRMGIIFLIACVAVPEPSTLLAITPQGKDGKEMILISNFEKVSSVYETGWKAAYGNAELVTDAHSGKQSLWCSNSVKLYSDELIEVEPGYIYHMSVWGKFKNVKFIGKGYGVGFGLEQQTADKKINGDWYYMQSYLKYAEGDSDWVFSEWNWGMPKETTVYLRPFLLVWAEPGSEAWFDDICVWKEKAPVHKIDRMINVIENGSFEVRYEMGKKANGFEVSAPEDLTELYRSRATCVEDYKYQGVASMKIGGECVMASGLIYIGLSNANAQVAVKTIEVNGAGAFARLVFYDNDRKVIETRIVVNLKGDEDWKIYNAELKNLNPKVRYVRWEFGMDKGAIGSAYFDDFQVNIPSTLQALPKREKNTEHVTVNIDCAAKGPVFESPLSAYDCGNSHLVYSPSIYTAGKFLEGTGRWFAERLRLGFKYVRIHTVYNAQRLCAQSWEDGKQKVTFMEPRTNYPEDNKPFGPVCSLDENGKIRYDFSSIKYVLDKAALKWGCKPIIGLAPVPNPLVMSGTPPDEWWDQWHYSPKDYKQWEELNYQFVKFLVDTYGKEEVKTWIFETGNEPGTEPEFHGEPGNRENVMNEFIKLQDYTIAGATRALPEIFIAGPSGPTEGWIESILDHCASGQNYATGKVGTKIDALEVHGYLGGSRSDISWRDAEDQRLRYQGYIERFYQKTGKRLKFLDTEFAPIAQEGGTDLNNLPHERNNHIGAIATIHAGYFSHRQGVSIITYFYEAPSYTNFRVTEEIPEFTGLNTCITHHGIFTPVCRAYQMMAMLNGGNEVQADADKEPVWALVTVTDKQIRVLCYSFEPNTTVRYTTQVDLSINTAGIGKKFQSTRYDLSETKANSWYLAQHMNLTQVDCENDISLVDKVNRESELKPEDAGMHNAVGGKINLTFDMPAYSAVLYVFDRCE